jgi:hypothetical protein
VELTVKELKPPCAPNPCPEGESEYTHGAVKMALIVIALLPEFTVSGFAPVLVPPLTVAEPNAYCEPPMNCGLMKLMAQFVLAFHVRFVGVV